MQVLFVSNLYPNSTEPSRGIFNSHQIRHLAKLCGVKVVAPIAWFPIRGRHAPKAPMPDVETLEGIEVHHPRHFYLPKVGRPLNPYFYARGIEPTVQSLRPFDVIFANWSFPDACGVAKLAAKMKVPFVASLSGSDVHAYLHYRIRSRQILRMLDAAQAVTTRSQDLKNLIVARGIPASKVHVVYNGVDPQRFQSLPRETARKKLGLSLTESILLFVGRLSPEKGADNLLRAFDIARRQHNLQARLVIVGDGPQRGALQMLATELGLTDHLTWAGWKKPNEISDYMNAANLLCLTSHNEGVANVVLESFACGLPVVATAVGGIPEVVTEETGLLVEARRPELFAAAMALANAQIWNPEAIRRHAATFNWDSNALQVQAILQDAVKSFSAN